MLKIRKKILKKNRDFILTIFTYSPSYFVTPSVPNRVFKMNKKIRILLIVRDPLTRLISDYTQILHNHMEKNLVFKPFRTLAFNPDGSVNLQYDALLRSLYVFASFSFSSKHVEMSESNDMTIFEAEVSAKVVNLRRC